jgi:N-sulfoglucosamine sulfohydrolase
VRAARDKRFKYMRNFYPQQPYLPWVPYRNRHPILQEIWRLHMAGRLTGPQALMFQCPRPPEELYDTQADPWEVNNLAGDPAYREDLERMRGALDCWRAEAGDLGDIPEAEMVRRWYPDGKRPTTAPPVFIPICEESPGTTPAPEGGSYAAPVLLQLHCATQGASIAYSFGDGDEARWLLYSEPLRLPEGISRIRARAIRIGYLESAERSAAFETRGAVTG